MGRSNALKHVADHAAYESARRRKAIKDLEAIQERRELTDGEAARLRVMQSREELLVGAVKKIHRKAEQAAVKESQQEAA